jgi:hypothetical protein
MMKHPKFKTKWNFKIHRKNPNPGKRMRDMKWERREPFLASGVPNLGLDDLIIDPNTSRGELDANRGLGFEAKFVPREPRQQVRFAHTRVPDQHHLEQVVVIIV